MDEPNDMADLPTTLAGMAEQARARLEAGPLGYYEGGAGDEITLTDNEASWRRYAIAPRVMVDVSAPDPSVTLLGRRRPHPILIAPAAYQRYATPEGELATVRAAAATSTTMCLSSQATSTPAEVAAAAPDSSRWFQLYVFKDRAVSDDLVAAARDGGYEALVLTVDFPVAGWRERDARTGFKIDLPVAINTSGKALTTSELFAMHDPTLTWDDIAHFAETSGLPVVLKGVLRPDDARLAVDAGVAGIIVSNHGGRQLDTVLSGVDALRPIVDEVGGDIDVLVDGGIRRGWDVLKALALGADAVLVARPILWGLACGGEAGARRVLEILLAELDNALALSGCPRARDLDPSFVLPAPWAH